VLGYKWQLRNTLTLLRSSRTSTLPKTTPRNQNQDIEVKVRDTAPVGGSGRRTLRRDKLKPSRWNRPKNLASQVTAAKQPKSEDNMIDTRTTGGAKGFKGKRKWLCTPGTKRRDSRRVLVHGVPVITVNINHQAQIIPPKRLQPERTIDEGLIVEALMQKCGYCDRGCKLKRCFNCQ
jgi:hypothetical protein